MFCSLAPPTGVGCNATMMKISLWCEPCEIKSLTYRFIILKRPKKTLSRNQKAKRCDARLETKVVIYGISAPGALGQFHAWECAQNDSEAHSFRVH